jgi:hypothetical protein
MPGLIKDAEHQALPPGTLKNSFPDARNGYAWTMISPGTAALAVVKG